MSKRHFHFNSVTHRFEASRLKAGQLILRFVLPAVLAVILSLGIRYSLGRHLTNPKEIKLLAEKEVLIDQYSKIENKIRDLETVLQEFQHWDDKIYRSFYELEPISASLRSAGLGGAARYSNLKGYESSPLMLDLTQRADMADIRLDLQGKSFSDVLFKAEEHEKLIDHKPSIQPISLQDFYWISSVFGFRTDPVSKRRAMHRGVDFAGRIGLSVYATGKGKVIRSKVSRWGFGKEVLVDHGFGYVTRYGHLESIDVELGQTVDRGTVIGTVGNTGKSTGPHLHYEVRRYGVAKNPKHYYSEDLTPQEYSEIVSQSPAVQNQALR